VRQHRMGRLAPAVAFAGLVLAGTPAAGAAPASCTADQIQQKLIDAGKLTPDDVKSGEVVDLVRCGDVTADGASDAIFTVASGGTAGDTRFGVLRGRPDGSLGGLLLFRQGYKIGIARHSRRSFDVIQPHYAAGEPNCCPGSFRVRRYRWTGTRFKAGPAKTLRTAPRRFYRP
jgi:hypothetical protein